MKESVTGHEVLNFMWCGSHSCLLLKVAGDGQQMQTQGLRKQGALETMMLTRALETGRASLGTCVLLCCGSILSEVLGHKLCSKILKIKIIE